MNTVIFFIYIHERNLNYDALIFFFNLKRSKSCGLVSMVLFGCLRISSPHDLLNNKAVNTWLRSTHIHALSRPICGIVIKNLKSIKNRQILINVFFGLKPKRRLFGCFLWYTHAHYSHAWLTLRLKNVLLKWYKHLYIAVTSKLGFCTEVYNFISLRLWLYLSLPDRYTMLGA